MRVRFPSSSSNELDMNDESSELEINDPDGDNESSNELGMNNQQAQISSTIGDKCPCKTGRTIESTCSIQGLCTGNWKKNRTVI